MSCRTVTPFAGAKSRNTPGKLRPNRQFPGLMIAACLSLTLCYALPVPSFGATNTVQQWMTGAFGVSDDCDADAVAQDRLKHDVNVRFVSIDGDDGKVGSIDEPWRTIRFGVSQLEAGGTLFIREGLYRESGMVVNANGTPEQPVSVRGYPCESIIIDGSELTSKVSDLSVWQKSDSRPHVYQTSALRFDQKKYSAEMIFNGHSQSMVTYVEDPESGGHGLQDLLSQEYGVTAGTRYVGPGIAVKDDIMYMRVDWPANVNAVGPFGKGISTVGSDELIVEITGAPYIFKITGSHIEISHLIVRGALRGITVDESVSNIVVKNLAFDVNSLAIAVNENVKELRLEGLYVKGDFPTWLAWTDMKGSDGQSKPAHNWINRPAAITAPGITGLTVTRSEFDNVFDGLVVDGSEIEISHNKGNVFDDMVQLGSNSSDVDIHDNLIVGGGIGHNGKGDSPKPGTIFVHHNVIDSRRTAFWSRTDEQNLLRPSYQGWKSPSPFPVHTFSQIVSGDPWKIYHNTVLFNSLHLRNGAGYHLWGQVNTTSSPHEVYNNIFADYGNGFFTSKIDIGVTGQVYDGNIYWSEDSSAIYKKLLGLDKNVTYGNLSEFIRSPAFEATKLFYQPGWDASSASIDPDLDENYRPRLSASELNVVVELPSNFPGSRSSTAGALSPLYK